MIKKKLNKLSITFLIALMAVLSFSSNANIKASTDYSNDVIINDWDLLDKDGNPLSITNGANYLGDYQFKIIWSVSPSGDTLHDGDTLSIPLPANAQVGTWGAVNSTIENFADQDGIVMGQWAIKDGKIEVVLNENAEGLNSITATFLTGKNALRNYTMKSNIQDVSIGNVTKSIKFNGAPTTSLKTYDYKYAGQASNSKIRWTVTLNNAGPVELSEKEWGAKFIVKNNTYFEDTLIDEGRNFSLNSINAYIHYPTDLASGSAGIQGYGYIITSKFTEVTQVLNETYAQFKARLQPLNWGVYTNENDEETAIVNFGNIGNNGLRYSDIDPNFANTVATSAINGGFYDESDRAELVNYFNKTYGNANIIGGNIARYAISLNADYNKVVLDTPKTNTATITANGISSTYNATGILQGNMGSTTVNKNTAGLFLYDENTSQLLPNATFKLQYNNAGAWQDYAPSGVMTTDDGGFIQTTTLGNGTYRFVQLTPTSNDYDISKSQGYDSNVGSVVSAEFTITPTDTEGAKVPVSNIKKKFNVIYAPGTQGIFNPDIHDDITIHSATPSFTGDTDESGKPIGQNGYVFAGWDQSIASTVTSTITYTALWKPSIATTTIYKVEHYLEQPDGVYALYETNNLSEVIGTSVFAKSNIYDGYTFDKSVHGTIESGAVSADGSLVLKLYYRKSKSLHMTVTPIVVKANTNAPGTGDSTSKLLLVGLMGISIITLATMVYRKIIKNHI